MGNQLQKWLRTGIFVVPFDLNYANNRNATLNMLFSVFTPDGSTIVLECRPNDRQAATSRSNVGARFHGRRRSRLTFQAVDCGSDTAC